MKQCRECTKVLIDCKCFFRLCNYEINIYLLFFFVIIIIIEKKRKNYYNKKLRWNKSNVFMIKFI